MRKGRCGKMEQFCVKRCICLKGSSFTHGNEFIGNISEVLSHLCLYDAH